MAQLCRKQQPTHRSEYCKLRSLIPGLVIISFLFSGIHVIVAPILGILPADTQQHSADIPLLKSNENDPPAQQDDPALTTEDNLAIAVIAFKNATETRLVERLIRSVRSRGQLPTTPVLVWTDRVGHYEHTLRDDPNVFVVYPTPDDEKVLNLPDSDFKAPTMKYKRFKTRLIDYLAQNPKWNSISRILYLDVDIVVCQPLRPFVDSYWAQFSSKAIDAPSWMAAFPQGGTAHGGLLFLSRSHSTGCLEYWRHFMDEGRQKYVRDMSILRMMTQQKKNKACHFFMFRRSRDEFIFPNQPSDLLPSKKYPRFVHITNTFHAQHLNASVQETFLEDALQLTEEERTSENSLAKTVATF